jgi:hypothetical protein
MKFQPSSWWTVADLVGVAATWSVASQQGSRRNALAASSALARRRQELLEVEEFLAEHATG